MIFAFLRPQDLFPFQGHPFTGIQFHQDLLAGDFVAEAFEEHLALVELGNAEELDVPEEDEQAVSEHAAENPPETGNPEIPAADGNGDGYGPPLLNEHTFKGHFYIVVLLEAIVAGGDFHGGFRNGRQK